MVRHTLKIAANTARFLKCVWIREKIIVYKAYICFFCPQLIFPTPKSEFKRINELLFPLKSWENLLKVNFGDNPSDQLVFVKFTEKKMAELLTIFRGDLFFASKQILFPLAPTLIIFWKCSILIHLEIVPEVGFYFYEVFDYHKVYFALCSNDEGQPDLHKWNITILACKSPGAS